MLEQQRQGGSSQSGSRRRRAGADGLPLTRRSLALDLELKHRPLQAGGPDRGPGDLASGGERFAVLELRGYERAGPRRVLPGSGQLVARLRLALVDPPVPSGDGHPTPVLFAFDFVEHGLAVHSLRLDADAEGLAGLRLGMVPPDLGQPAAREDPVAPRGKAERGRRLRGVRAHLGLRGADGPPRAALLTLDRHLERSLDLPAGDDQLRLVSRFVDGLLPGGADQPPHRQDEQEMPSGAHRPGADQGRRS